MEYSEKNVLEIEKINKSFPGVKALSDVTFNIRSNSVHGLVGENGAGKSTLIKILSGVHKPDDGILRIDGKVCDFENPGDSFKAGISTIYQELSVIDDITIAQDLFFGEEEKFLKFGFINFREMNRRAKEILENLGFDFNVIKKVNTLSISDKQQLEIAKAINKNSKIILMDEPTSALSDKEVDNLFKIINDVRKKGVSIIYISHHLDEIFKICDEITIMRDGRIIDTLKLENSQFMKDIVIKYMVGKNIANIKTNRNRKIFSKDVALETKNYSTSNGVRDVNLKLHHGEILGIYGTLGSKRTELFKSIFTGEKKISGEIILNDNILNNNNIANSILNGMGFLPEDKKDEGLFLNLPILKNIPFILYNKESRFGFLNQKAGIKVTNEYKELLNIKTPSINQIVAYLSGGNQQKVVLGKLLAANCKILILDEPLVGIDVGTKNEILDIINNLANEDKSIIIISSELPELLRISDRVLIMRNGRIIKEITDKFDQEEIISYAVGGKGDE